jgi:hypothetical protein
MQGVTQKALMEELPDIPLEELAPALNVLLSRHQLQIYTQGSTLYYKPVNQVRLQALSPMSIWHKLVKLFVRFPYSRDGMHNTSTLRTQFTYRPQSFRACYIMFHMWHSMIDDNLEHVDKLARQTWKVFHPEKFRLSIRLELVVESTGRDQGLIKPFLQSCLYAARPCEHLIIIAFQLWRSCCGQKKIVPM